MTMRLDLKKELRTLARGWINDWCDTSTTEAVDSLVEMLNTAVIMGVVAGLEAGEQVEECEAIADKVGLGE